MLLRLAPMRHLDGGFSNPLLRESPAVLPGRYEIILCRNGLDPIQRLGDIDPIQFDIVGTFMYSRAGLAFPMIFDARSRGSCHPRGRGGCAFSLTSGVWSRSFTYRVRFRFLSKECGLH